MAAQTAFSPIELMFRLVTGEKDERRRRQTININQLWGPERVPATTLGGCAQVSPSGGPSRGGSPLVDGASNCGRASKRANYANERRPPATNLTELAAFGGHKTDPASSGGPPTTGTRRKIRNLADGTNDEEAAAEAANEAANDRRQVAQINELQQRVGPNGRQVGDVKLAPADRNLGRNHCFGHQHQHHRHHDDHRHQHVHCCRRVTCSPSADKSTSEPTDVAGGRLSGPNWRRRRVEQVSARKRRPQLQSKTAGEVIQLTGQMIGAEQPPQRQESATVAEAESGQIKWESGGFRLGAARHAHPAADDHHPLEQINVAASKVATSTEARPTAAFGRTEGENREGSKFNESNENKCESKCFGRPNRTTTTTSTTKAGRQQPDEASPGRAVKGATETTDIKMNGRLIIAATLVAGHTRMAAIATSAIDPSTVCCGQRSGAASLGLAAGALKGDRHASEMNVPGPGTGNKNKANPMIDYAGECDDDDAKSDDYDHVADGRGGLDDSCLCYRRRICARRRLCGRPLSGPDTYNQKPIASRGGGGGGGGEDTRIRCTEAGGHLFAAQRRQSTLRRKQIGPKTRETNNKKLVSNKKSRPLTSVLLAIRAASLLLLMSPIISHNAGHVTSLAGLVQVSSLPLSPSGQAKGMANALFGASSGPFGMGQVHLSTTASSTTSRSSPNRAKRFPRTHRAASDTGKRVRRPGSQRAKFAFWLNLLIKLGEISGSQMESIDHLAGKMTDWPDQRRAALFYLELLARAPRPAGAGPTFGGSCLRVSLGQLMAASSVRLTSLEAEEEEEEEAEEDGHIFGGNQDDDGRAGRHSKPGDVDEADDDDDNDGARRELKRRALGRRERLEGQLELLKTLVALDELRPEPVSSPVDSSSGSSWLASFTSTTRPANNATSRNSRLAKSLGRRHSTSRELALRLAVDNANLISRLLFRPPSSKASGASKLDASIELLNQLAASPRFFRYLLANKVREFVAPPTGALHSAGLIIWDYLGDDGSVRYLFGQMALIGPHNQVDLVDLLAHPTASNATSPNGYFRAQIGRPKELPAPSFLLKWLLAEQLAQLTPLKERISLANWLRSSRARRANLPENSEENQEDDQTLKVEDGSWFWPHFDCGVTNRWLLAYSIPIFSFGSSSEEPIRLRGVSFVQLDLLKLGPLIDQCSSDEGSSFLANTQQCPLRLTSGQCVQLPASSGDENNNYDEAGPPLRPGNYVCQCPAAGGSLKASVDANKGDGAQVDLVGGGGGGGHDDQRRLQTDSIEAKRKQLSELLASRASSGQVTNGTNNNLLDLIAIEQIAEYPGNRQLVGTKLLQQQQRGHPSERPSRLPHFELGAELEHDLVLDWFAQDPARSDEGAPYLPLTDWPRESCCEQGDCPPKATDALSAALREGEPPRPMDWANPLVLFVQVACILVTLVLIAVLLRVRKSRIIVVSGWLMLETMLLGALMLYTSVLVHYFRPTSLTCLLEPWLRELGFSIFYGSILIKLYKILAEFQTRKAHRVCLRDKDQAVYLLAIVLIVVGYMSAWTALMIDGFSVGSRRRHSSQPPLAANSSAGSAESRSPTSDSPLIVAASDSLDAIYLASANEHQPLAGPLNYLSHGLDSFGELFSGLLESERQYDAQNDLLFYSTRCRKLTWDYVTESSEMALLLFGLHLVYKLRNATGELHKEKLILCGSVSLELLTSTLAYLARHALWHKLNSNHLLLLYAIRCQFTVTLTVALLFGPKLWAIGMSKPSGLFGAFGSSSSSSSTNRTGGSVRHRCHISCELHDHHLNDATKLHQAMLSNAALEIGSINLADMDPDEIQAELKRVYTQLEVLKTKAMRRDNPHISKRRGGRKPGHRKFSLQAFHARHSSSSEQQPGPAAGTGNKQLSGHHADQGSLISGAARLPVVSELESGSPMDTTASSTNKKSVRVDEVIQQYDSKRQRKGNHDESANEQQREPSFGEREQRSNNYHRQQSGPSKSMAKQTAENKTSAPKKHIKLMEVPSTSSCGLDHDEMMAMIESQSSGETSPIDGQRQTSVMFGPSSVQQVDYYHGQSGRHR